MDDIRWGIIGPGRIARGVAADFEHVPGAILAGVASRSAERSAAFAADFGVEKFYGSYGEIIADPDIDVLYISTPHPQHHAIALAAIAAGKHLLVEKSFTATVAGAEQIVAAARHKGVFVMEAMWTRFQPTMVEVRRRVEAGEIGDVRAVQADLGVDRPYDPQDRLFDPEQGGGAMLDLGVYVVSLAQWFLGTPEKTHVVGSLAPTGVDMEAAILIDFCDGKAASLVSSLRQASPGSARIIGTKGVIDIPPRFHHPASATITVHGQEPEVIDAPPSGTGYSHELIEVTERIKGGHTESEVMPLADTLTVQRILNDAAEQLGVFHSEDDSVDV